MATGHLPGNIFMVCGLLIIASCLGNMNGYWLGLKAGRIMYIRKESRFFKRKHLAAAVAFYIKHGNWSLAAGLFFPIIRTFAPVVSGMIQLKFNRFVLFTLFRLCPLDNKFCDDRLPGRHHALSEALFKVFDHRYFPHRNNARCYWYLQKSK